MEGQGFDASSGRDPGGVRAPGRVAAVALARVKGVPKDPVERVRLVRGQGVEGDAHAGPGPRQVSLLGLPGIRAMEIRFGSALGFGRFGENVVVEGALDGAAPGDLVALGDEAVLEVTVIGKECHHGCVIRQRTGDCIMPREGVFTRVLAGGEVATGDAVRWLRPSRDLAVVLLAGDSGGPSGRASGEEEASWWGRVEEAVETARSMTPEVVLVVDSREEDLPAMPGVAVAAAEPGDGPLRSLAAAMTRCRAPAVLAWQVGQAVPGADLLRVLAMRRRDLGLCLHAHRGAGVWVCSLDRTGMLPMLQEVTARSECRPLEDLEAFPGVVAMEGVLPDQDLPGTTGGGNLSMDSGGGRDIC